MDSKSHMGFKPDVRAEEIQTYLRWSKILYYGLCFTMFVNLILTYGLIFHGSKPSLTTCAKLYPYVHFGEPPATAYVDIPSVEPPMKAELVVREVITKDVKAKSLSELTEIDARWDYGDVRTGVTLAMGGYWVINQGIQWWNMLSACKDFSNAANGINCVWGAVTTAMTAGGTIYSVYKGAGHISTYMQNNNIQIGWKREVIDQGLLDEFTTVFGAKVVHLGAWNFAPHIVGAPHIRQVANATVDVFGFNANGTDMHFSYLGNSTNGPTFRIGFGLGSSSNTKREAFDQQYFTSGGIDFVIFENPDNYPYISGGALDTYSDYEWIYEQTACLMVGSMDAAGHYFQMYDNVHQTTLVAGAVAPFRDYDHWSAISAMAGGKPGLPINPNCSK